MAGPLELGRQRENEPAPFGVVPASGNDPARLIIATRSENTVPRTFLLLEPLPDGRVRASNRSPIPFARADGALAIPAQSSVELVPPFSLSLPPRTIVVSAGSDSEPGLHSLSDQTYGPGGLQDASRRWMALRVVSTALASQMEDWLKATMGVLQSAVGSADFVDRAAEALVQIVGLHAGRVLLLEGDTWKAVACNPTSSGSDWRPSTHVLAHVRQQKKTFWQTSQQPGELDTPSMPPHYRVIAAPLLDSQQQVIGALYGERPAGGSQSTPDQARLEALLVDLLASGVSTGLARQEQERQAAQDRVRFEQFFTPHLAERLRRDPDMLQGRDAEVTVLFTDVRGFSKFSEMLGPQKTIAWMNEVMNALSQCVLDQEGVLVDYIGDELMAMWGAPEPQTDQRERAIRAGLAMIAALPKLNEKWQPILKEPMNIGVGINSGPAQVGNTGSSFKFKYGPLGNTVNLASRVQGLTKYLRCRLLVTADTRQGLGEELIARRVVRTRVVNINEPVELFEVEARSTPEQQVFFRDSELALKELEEGLFAEAAGRSGGLLLSHRGDGPLLLTLSRATTQLVQGGKFDPVWDPPGK
jgi:adenylate cyclase